MIILEIAQARPTLHATLMQRMTDVLSRMLNDPATRAALSGGGEDSLEGDENNAAEAETVASPSTEPSPNTAPYQLVSDETASTSQPFSSISASAPQHPGLSVHSPISETVSSINNTVPSSSNTSSVSYSSSNSSIPYISSTVTESTNALDLSQVPQLNLCSSEQPIPGGTLGASERYEADSESMVPGQSVPSQDVHSESSNASRASPALLQDSELVHHNISNLQDQLSTMREGFIER